MPFQEPFSYILSRLFFGHKAPEVQSRDCCRAKGSASTSELCPTQTDDVWNWELGWGSQSSFWRRRILNLLLARFPSLRGRSESSRPILNPEEANRLRKIRKRIKTSETCHVPVFTLIWRCCFFQSSQLVWGAACSNKPYCNPKKKWSAWSAFVIWCGSQCWTIQSWGTLQLSWQRGWS